MPAKAVIDKIELLKGQSQPAPILIGLLGADRNKTIHARDYRRGFEGIGRAGF